MQRIHIPFDTIRITIIPVGFEVTFIYKEKEMVTQTKIATLVKGDSLWLSNMTGTISTLVNVVGV